jgi:predicted nucleotidyltransferase
MLYGSRLFINDLMQEVTNVETERDIKIIFGSTIGSISRGTQRYTSDYDVRFLYVDRNHNFIDRCDRHTEDRIRYRKFNDNKAYNCIAFWEASAFLNFLHEPYINQGIQYKLARNVIWSFFSPYQFDPYGISAKILPLLTKVVNIDCEINHYYSLLGDYCQTRDPFVSLNDYFQVIHAYLSLLWIKQERTIPPLHIVTLMSLADNVIYDHINYYLALNRSYDNLSVDLINAEITDSIYEHFTTLMRDMQTREIDILNEFKKSEHMVQNMLYIIQNETKNNQTVYHVNDSDCP